MQVDIYNSNIRKLKFIVVPNGTIVSDSALNLTDTDFSSVTLFKSNVALEEGLVGLNFAKATSDLANQGYHIVEITINVEVI